MKTLFQSLAFICVFASCEKADTIPLDNELAQGEITSENEIPYITLRDLSPGFSFYLRSMLLPSISGLETPKPDPYLAIINDEDTYLWEMYTDKDLPTIDFSKNTLLAVGLVTGGTVETKLVQEDHKVIFKIHIEIPRNGFQGDVPHFYSAIVPKLDSTNAGLEITITKEK